MLKQVPGFQQEREAVAVAKETHDAQLEKKNAEIQLLKKRFAIPSYVKVCIPSVCWCLLTGCFLLSLLPLQHFIAVCVCAGVLGFA